MKANHQIVAAALLMSCWTAALAKEEVKFTAAPQATRAGDTVRITFAVSAPTDVQVSIADEQGRMVRRLAAGLLGRNAPAPFARDSLAQELAWDGRNDDGRQVLAANAKAAFKVRVAAGLKVSFAGTAFGASASANTLTNVIGLAVGADGRVFVLSERWHRLWWNHTAIHVYNRSGQYEKTIKPFPATLPPEKLARLTPLKDEQGRAVPIIHRVLAIDYYPTEDLPQQMAVTPDGNLHLLNFPDSYIGDRTDREERYIVSLAPDGSVAYDSFAGPDLGARTLDAGDVYLAPASDGKSLFVTGMDITITKAWDPDEPRPRRINVPAVFRVDLPDRDRARLFFGDPAKADKDDAHVTDPRGLASDGKGSLYVADYGNDRVVVVSEKDGRFVRSFDVKSPTWIGISKATGAIYVATAGQVVKFVEQDGKLAERAKLPLPELAARDRSAKWSFALDGQKDTATLWVGLSRGGEALRLCQEKGDKFGELKKADYGPAQFYWSMASGYDGKTVVGKVGDRTLRVLDEQTGQSRDLKLEDSTGQTYRLGPDNQIYGMDHSGGLRRWDASGRPLPFPAGSATGAGRLSSRASGTTFWERDFDVDRAGNIYIKQRGKVYHGRMTVDKFDKDGKLLGTVLWVVSDGAQGPRLDGAGNLYIAESLKPVGEEYPDYFKDKLPKVNVDHNNNVAGQYRWMYGSIVKFSPVGGAVWFPIADARRDIYAFEGEAGLPADQPKVKVDTASGDRVVTRTGELQGALWFHFGVSYILDMQPGANRRCHCTGTDFDVDEYGRTFYTDQGRFRVVVLDSAGNELLTAGAYGNQDSLGKEGSPEVAFNWFTGLAASDRYIYVGDGGNRRAVKLAIQHAIEQTCPVK